MEVESFQTIGSRSFLRGSNERFTRGKFPQDIPNGRSGGQLCFARLRLSSTLQSVCPPDDDDGQLTTLSTQKNVPVEFGMAGKPLGIVKLSESFFSPLILRTTVVRVVRVVVVGDKELPCSCLPTRNLPSLRFENRTPSPR